MATAAQVFPSASHGWELGTLGPRLQLRIYNLEGGEREREGSDVYGKYGPPSLL